MNNDNRKLSTIADVMEMESSVLFTVTTGLWGGGVCTGMESTPVMGVRLNGRELTPLSFLRQKTEKTRSRPSWFSLNPH